MAQVLTARTVALEVTHEELKTIREGLESLRVYGSTDGERKAIQLLNDTDSGNWKPVNA
ncbi:hypothetical protein HOS57_gp34 [Streptomyces phage AbbeyMikolon]|uniref:Uncharacterized protein n=1 Tax=Streptomyces phage AbbeyMikolon TaxID=2059880 RepID=A0A2H5BL98_9CAUD|nr:hypothetical protein HOS57_gp34 [Streptomyces phage AbbeyMikolon]AUG87106.1 hypothetical protein SEA_ABBEYMIKOLON_34 [Streptomyces phage AbbeyMikolon]